MRQTDAHNEPQQPLIGARLRSARDRLGYSQSDIADRLKIQRSFVDAIENMDSDALPAIGYVLGYIRGYAGIVGIDVEEAVKAYKVDSQTPDNLGLRSSPHFVPKKEIRLPKGLFAIIALLSCAVGLAIWYGTHSVTQNSLTTRSNTSKTQQAQTLSETPSDIMTLSATAPSWVEARNEDGEVILSKIFVTGETWQAGINDGIQVSVRDGGALNLYVGEDLIGPLGTKGTPIASLSLPFTDAVFNAATVTTLDLSAETALAAPQ